MTTSAKICTKWKFKILKKTEGVHEKKNRIPAFTRKISSRKVENVCAVKELTWISLEIHDYNKLQIKMATSLEKWQNADYQLLSKK